MNKHKLTTLSLRVGLAFVFAYAAIASFITPGNWLAFLPQFLVHFLPLQTFLVIFSVTELILAAWLLSGRKIFYASLAATAILFGIIVTNITFFDIVFRDIAILFSAVSLTLLSKQQK